jgi:hypothetical protein
MLKQEPAEPGRLGHALRYCLASQFDDRAVDGVVVINTILNNRS